MEALSGRVMEWEEERSLIMSLTETPRVLLEFFGLDDTTWPIK